MINVRGSYTRDIINDKCLGIVYPGYN